MVVTVPIGEAVADGNTPEPIGGSIFIARNVIPTYPKLRWEE